MALFGFGNKKKFEKLKKCLEEENYDGAVMVADQISIHKTKNISELNMLGKAYKKHEDFLLAREFFERSYRKRCSRTVLMDLMDCCLEIKDLESTESYFNEYQRLVPEDKVTQYKYRYEIEKRKGRERHLLIMILEELKAIEYVEEYAYELALQYHKVGRKQDCINECNDIILWFGTGESVERARILLAYYKGEIGLEEAQFEGTYYPKSSVIQQMKENEKKGEDVWIAQKAAKLREEVKKIEETPNFHEEVKKAEEAAKAREEARRAEEVKRMQQEVKEEVPFEKINKTIEETKKTKEVLHIADISKQREEAKRFEEIRRAEEIKRAREELKRAEEAVAKAKEEAKRIEEAIKLQEETKFAKEMEEEILPLEKEVVEEVAFTKQEDEISFEKKDEPVFFSLETENIQVSKEQYRELATILERKKISLSEILKSFGRIEEITKQILLSMDIALKTRETSFFVIMGEEKSGKTKLALTMINLLFELGLVQYDKTAIMDATQLNQISIKEYASQLKNCNIVVQRAGSMTEKTVEDLINFFKENKKETCLFLEDSNIQIANLLSLEKEWTKIFYNQILLQEYTTENLMGFAYDYITKEDYSIEYEAAKVLRDKIDEIVKFHGKESSLCCVMQLAKEILRHAEQRVNTILLGMVSEGKIQTGSYLVICPEDIV